MRRDRLRCAWPMSGRRPRTRRSTPPRRPVPATAGPVSPGPRRARVPRPARRPRDRAASGRCLRAAAFLLRPLAAYRTSDSCGEIDATTSASGAPFSRTPRPCLYHGVVASHAFENGVTQVDHLRRATIRGGDVRRRDRIKLARVVAACGFKDLDRHGPLRRVFLVPGSRQAQDSRRFCGDRITTQGPDRRWR